MIKVDTREPFTIIEYLGQYDVPSRRMTLNENSGHPKADYVIETDGTALGVQRKEVNDFVGSIDTLKDDLYELRQHHDSSALLIEGSYKLMGESIGLRRGRRMEEAMSTRVWHNFLLSQQFRGTLLFRTEELRETAQVLVYAHEWLDGPMTPPVTKQEDPSSLLMMMPGIGPKTAEAIEAEFGSAYRALINIDRWHEADGIGPKTKGSIEDWLRGGA